MAAARSGDPLWRGPDELLCRAQQGVLLLRSDPDLWLMYHIELWASFILLQQKRAGVIPPFWPLSLFFVASV